MGKEGWGGANVQRVSHLTRRSIMVITLFKTETKGKNKHLCRQSQTQILRRKSWNASGKWNNRTTDKHTKEYIPLKVTKKQNTGKMTNRRLNLKNPSNRRWKSSLGKPQYKPPFSYNADHKIVVARFKRGVSRPVYRSYGHDTLPISTGPHLSLSLSRYRQW